MLKITKVSLALTCILLAMPACQNGTTTAIPTFDPNNIQTVIAGTSLAAQTQTRAASTDTPTPTNTLPPTDTPLPTNTPLPTETPIPLLTSTALPQPKTYEGSGNKIIALPPDAAGVLYVVTDSAFALQGYTETGETNFDDLLIYSSRFYEGRVPLNLIENRMATLHIGAVGAWKIIYYPLGSDYDHVLKEGDDLTFSGSGDDVWLSSLHIEPEKLHITWDQEEDRHIFVNVIGLHAHHKMSTRGMYENLMYWYPNDLGELLAVVVDSRDQSWKIKIYP